MKVSHSDSSRVKLKDIIKNGFNQAYNCIGDFATTIRVLLIGSLPQFIPVIRYFCRS